MDIESVLQQRIESLRRSIQYIETRKNEHKKQKTE